MMKLPEVPSWDLLAAFLAVQKTGSLSGASRALGAAQPTVRRQIEALEEALGLALFTRSPMGLTPTNAAMAMLPYAESMAASTEALVRNASAATAIEGGTVRVTASEVLGVLVLPTILADLARKHPLLCIELAATNERLDLLRRDADIAVRMTQPTQGALVAKRVGSVGVGLFASDAYLASRGTPKTVAELSREHALIGRDRDDAFYAALSASGVRKKRRDFALRTDSDVAQLSAIQAGWGIGVCQVALASRTTGLRRVLPKLGFDLPVWVVTHEDLRASRPVSIVFEHLVVALTKYAC